MASWLLIYDDLRQRLGAMFFFPATTGLFYGEKRQYRDNSFK